MLHFCSFQYNGSSIEETARGSRRDSGDLPFVGHLALVPLLLGMIVEDSYILPQTSKLLNLPQDPDRQHPLRKMRLGAFCLSGKPWRVQAYMDKQQIVSLIPGGHLQQSSIGVISKMAAVFKYKKN